MNPELHYAGFWRRFAALWLDFLFLLPVMLAYLWLNQRHRWSELFYLGPSFAISFVYSIHLVRRFGGTPGKVLAGLRIVKVDGSPIGYREATLRCLPEWVLSTALSVGLALAALKMTDAQYTGLGYIERHEQLKALAPAWLRPVEIFQQVWIWSEFLVLLTNKKRRALHDFIAGTVVVMRTPERISRTTNSPALAAAPGQSMAPVADSTSV